MRPYFTTTTRPLLPVMFKVGGAESQTDTASECDDGAPDDEEEEDMMNEGFDESSDEDYEGLLASMPKRPYDYFKMFWGDTAVFGSRAATVCGLEFFGADQVVFASDAPFDPEGGSMYIRETLKVIDSLDISAEARRKIYQGNAERLFNRKF